MTTFSELIESPNNNLNLIRLLAASAVTYSHAYILTGHPASEPWFVLTATQTLAYLAVFVFFVISGLLISRSFDQNPNVAYYLGSRALRIYPALILTLLLCALPLGMALTHLTTTEYLQSPGVVRYVFDNLKLSINYELPGVFSRNLVTKSVNGSLWTLAFEVYAYLMVMAFGLLGLLQNRNLFNFVCVMLVLIYMKEPAGFLLAPSEWEAPMYVPLAGFLFGAFVYVNRCQIECRLWYCMLALVIYYIFRDSEFHRVLFTMAVGYTTLTLGFHPKLQLKAVLENDYSYGIYVYSFPVQQMIISLMPNLRPVQHFFLATLAIFPLAYLSWHVLEKPSLKLKRYLPGSAN